MMKLNKQLLVGLSVLCPTFFLNLHAQEKSVGELPEYNRSSLGTMMVYHSEDEFGNEIRDAFMKVPTPDKYNEHNVNCRELNNSDLMGAQRRSNGLIKAEMGKRLSSRDVEKNGKALENRLNELGCGKMMVSRWFDLKGTSVDSAYFDMKLIQERGQYNASEMDVAIAEQSARGIAMLSDAGEDLIYNSFILVNDMTYVTVEEQMQAAQIGMSILGGVIDALASQPAQTIKTTGANGRVTTQYKPAVKSTAGADMAQAFKDITDDYTGFKVKTHSYLFQLQWNDSVAAVFYKNYYTSEPNSEKIRAFLNNDSLFQMKFVAHEYEYDNQSAIKGQYDRGEFIKIICTRSMDKNIAALQLQYEDFKVKTPVFDVIQEGKNTVYAGKIGLKEGISEKSKFQVVQRKYNPETGRTTYKYVATVKPIKDRIWDNRYAAASEHSEGSELHYTAFKKTSGGEIFPGMLLIEGKYRKVTE